ncbi:MAG: pyridoxal-phosphate dependent enzyme family protein [uncultured Thermomicrobiales bacterium]|uniref:Pyridoxal-phosphate dependent enzyme family protein n=1 Tax=uncultured Thermomicrobiales bacterium TaxID=1645740 RepID=A0A6J4UM30_9BACT|nr:MAG: pyridoxal-phosphate dependent enzyme family protein [uncultured Thermomicrobiales bacterium]
MGGGGDGARRITFERIEAAAKAIPPVFRETPQYVCEPLAAALRAALTLKVETANPIRSFKGRGASWLVANLAGREPLMCASAGNFGQAMAWACRAAGVPLTVYAGVHANPLKLERMRAMGAAVVLAGEDFDAAKAEGKRVAAARGVRFVEDSRDPEPTEGAGTIGLELVAAGMLDAVVVPLGNGAMLAGVATALRALQPEARIVAVQADGAAAMTESLQSGRRVVHDRVETIADGIGVRVPVPEALADLEGLVDEFLLVDDATIVAAMKLLFAHAGLVAEPSGAVGVAALLAHPARFAGARVATVVCGGNLTPEQARAWLG